MIDRFHYSMRSLQQFTRAQEVSANNLANINTPGYKKDSLFYRQLTREMGGDGQTPEIFQGMTMQAGSFEQTGNDFDLAINGEGFFAVEYEDESLLSRNGQFTLDGDGYLRDQNGAYVQGASGRVHLPEFYQLAEQRNEQPRVDISTDGTIRLNDEVVDQVQLMEVDDHNQLQRRANAYLAPGEDQTVRRNTSSEIQQGFYEASNVDPLTEMTDMMTNMRIFESQQRALRTTDEMLGRVTTELGRF